MSTSYLGFNLLLLSFMLSLAIFGSTEMARFVGAVGSLIVVGIVAYTKGE